MDPELVVSADELKTQETDNLLPVAKSVNGHLQAINQKILTCQAGYESSMSYDFSNDFPSIDGVDLKQIQTLVLHNVIEILEKKGYRVRLDIPEEKNNIILYLSWESRLCSKKFNKMREHLNKVRVPRNPRKPAAD